MTTPTSRQEFKEYCLRRLGKPILEINIDDDQVDDRVDEALRYFWDYHFDGSEKQYYKYQIQNKNYPNNLADVVVGSGGTGYSNSDVITISPDSSNTVITLNPVTNASGTITSVPVDQLYTGNTSYHFATDPSYTITTSTGSGAILQPLKGGFIPIPDNIIGVVHMFPVGQALNTNNLFNIRYQIALNDLYTLTSVSMVPYYMALQHVQFLEQMLVGQQPIRYNRHKNRCYVDMDWNIVTKGDYVILESYGVVDPNIYTQVWSDRWLQRYAACLIKQQWGWNLTKFIGMQMPGGIQFNGAKILDDATAEREALEKEMITSYSLPVTDMIG
jgi:hypothetical protein